MTDTTRLFRTLAVTSFAAILSTSAMAATTPSNAVKDLTNGDEVTVSGTVENFDSRHPFTLRDSSGTVQVDLSNAKPIVLKNGQLVTITGIVDKGILETDIAAEDVSLTTTSAGATNSVADEIKGQAPSSAPQSVQIKSIPETGFVKLTGTVETVDGATAFTLKDSSGTISVAVKAGNTSALKAGSSVVVIGYLDRENLGKTLNATEIHSGNPSEAMANQ